MSTSPRRVTSLRRGGRRRLRLTGTSHADLRLGRWHQCMGTPVALVELRQWQRVWLTTSTGARPRGPQDRRIGHGRPPHDRTTGRAAPSVPSDPFPARVGAPGALGCGVYRSRERRDIDSGVGTSNSGGGIRGPRPGPRGSMVLTAGARSRPLPGLAPIGGSGPDPTIRQPRTLSTPPNEGGSRGTPTAPSVLTRSSRPGMPASWSRERSPMRAGRRSLRS